VLVVHPHFHRRRTGVTRHVESVVHAPGAHEARALGSALDEVPRIGIGELLARARQEPVIWHAHRNHELALGILLRALSSGRVRVVFTRHSLGRASGLTRWLAGKADRVVALTRFVGEGVGRACEVVGHGIDLGRFSPPASHAEAFGALGLGGRFGIGVVGRIREAKGHGDYARALAPLLEKNPEWRSVWIGHAKRGDRAWAETLAAQLGPAHRTLPEQREITAWYRGLTVLVQPSHSESYSLVLLEAMASGCCVVAAEMPHYREFIEHGRTGLLYPPGDVEALRTLLEPLLAEPERAEAIGRAAAEVARARFGVAHEVRALEALYASVTAHGERRAEGP
jgi:mannosyltransferase